MRDLDLKSLRLLVAVCDLGNMKEAAAQEHIEPSAISKRIAQLEHTIGTPVLVRGRRGAQPTPAGRALLEHARTVLFTLERIEADMAAFKGGIKGQVRLVASASAIAESLLDDLAQFMRVPEHQDIQVDIEEHFSRDIVGMVRDGVVSLGVCWAGADPVESTTSRTDQVPSGMAPSAARIRRSPWAMTSPTTPATPPRDAYSIWSSRKRRTPSALAPI